MHNIRTELNSKEDHLHFDTADYIVFGFMLTLSAFTGLYYGCFQARKQNDSRKFSEYLTGDKKMKCFPVSMSLVASYISGVTIIGTPAEIYNYGTQYFLIIISIWVMSIIVAFVYLPVFCSIELTSSYEYLEKRFSKSLRTFASVMFLIDEILFLPMVIYVPALAFNQVTGMNLHVIGTIVTCICIFYTVLGGIRAVIWTDTWQIITMFISVLVVTFLGTIAVGGLAEIVERNEQGNRIQFFNFNTSLYERQSVFSVLIGGTFYWTAFNSVNQTMVQRYLSLPTLKESRKSLFLFTIGVSLFVGVCCFMGMIIFATYSKCDPLASGKIRADDQLLPLFVMQTVGHLKGVPGLFIAGVFGAALSSLSVILNSTSIVLLEDCMKSCLRKNPSERTAKIFVKLVVVTLGLLAIGFLYIIEHLGGVLATATSLSAIAASTSFGIFSLGILFPCANTKGAVTGAFAGALIAGWISLGTQYAMATNKMISAKKLPISTEGCANLFMLSNSTQTNTQNEPNVFPLYRLSFHWITPIGSLTVILVGLIVSLLTGGNDLQSLDPNYISPVVVKWCLTKETNATIGTKLNRDGIELN